MNIVETKFILKLDATITDEKAFCSSMQFDKLKDLNACKAYMMQQDCRLKEGNFLIYKKTEILELII